MPLRRLLTMLTAAVLVAVCNPVRAGDDVKLIETIWVAQSADCPIREVNLHDFGRAVVVADKIGSDGAAWNFDPPVLHIYFDTWNGNLDGQILGDNDFQATYFWRSDETLTQSSVACPFKRQ